MAPSELGKLVGRVRESSRVKRQALEPLEPRTLMTAVYWTGGSGTWNTNTTNKSWRLGGQAGPLVAWSNSAGYDAVFSDSGSTVTVGSSVSVNSIQFTGTGDQVVGRYGLVLGGTATGGRTALSGTILVQAGSTATIATSIGGTFGLTLNGAGTVQLSASPAYTGATTVNAGVLNMTDNPAIGLARLTPRALVVNSGGTVLANAQNAISFATSLTVNSGGTLSTGNGVHARLAALTLDGGTLASGTPDPAYGSWQFASAQVNVAVNTVVSATEMAGSVVWSVNAGVTADVTGSFGGTSLGAASIFETGGGTMILAGDDSSSIGTAIFNVSGSTLQVGTGTTNGLLGSATLYDAGLIIYDDPATESFAGAITGPGAVQVAGGTLVLTAASTYTGGTTISAGTLSANNSTGSATGTGAVNVAGGAALTGNGFITGAVVVAVGGTLNATGVLGVGPLSLASGSTLQLGLNGNMVGSGYSQVNVAGTAQIAGATLSASGSPTGTYPMGLNVLATTASIVGTFANLPQGGTISSGGMNFTADYAGYNGNDLALTPVTPQTITVGLSSSGTQVVAGQAVTFSAWFNAAPATVPGQVPTGVITFQDGPVVLGTVSVGSASVSTFSTSSLSVGSHTIAAAYSGDANFAAATSSVVVEAVAPSVGSGTVSLSAAAVSGSAVALSWAVNYFHSGYAIYRSAGGSALAPVAAVSGSVSTFSDSGLLQGVSYSYQVVATDDGSTSGTVSATTLLPAPAYKGPVVEPTYSKWFRKFSAPVSSSVPTDTAAPSIDNYTQTADPGDTVAVTAEGLTNATVSGPAGTGAGFLAYGQTNASNGVLSSASIQTLTGQAAAVTLSGSLPSDSLYFVWPSNTDSSGVTHYGTPVVVNAPQLWWADQSDAIPGGLVSLFGRNLTKTPDGSNPADVSWVYLQNDNGLGGQWITARSGTTASPDVNPYKVDFTLPANLYGGSYTVWVNNGLAGHYSWSNALQLTVGFSPWTPQQVSVTQMTQAGLLSAIATANSEVVAANGTPHVVDVNIPAGTILITQPIELPGDLQLIGAGDGAGGTLLQVPAGSALNEAVDLGIQGGNGLQNLAINADNGGIAMSSLVGGDGRQPTAVQVGSVSQVISNVSVSDVNPNARSAPDVNASTPVTDLRISGSTFIGPGLNFVGATDLLVTGCTFVGAGAGNAAFSIFNGTDVAFTDSTIENLSNDPSLEYASSARVFWQATLGDDIYVGGNTSVGLFPEAVLYSGLNGGEQILSESNETQYEGSPLAATNVTVGSGNIVAADTSVGTITLPAAVIPGQSWTVTVSAGPGLGETAIVTSTNIANGVDTITLDRPWAVVPTTASIISLGTTADRFVVYSNSLSGDGNQSFNGDTDGVQLGGTDIVIANNSVTGTGAGISLHSDEKYAGENATVCDFDQISGNTVSNVHFGLVSEGASSVPEPGDLQIGNVWEDNSVTDVHNTPLGGDLPSGIWVSTWLPFANGQFADNIYQNNAITAPIAMSVTPGGNQGPIGVGATTDTLVIENSFASDGSLGSTGVLSTVTEAGWATLVDNSYSGFTQNYNVPLTASTGQLIAPQRAYSVTVAPGQTASATLLIESAAGATMFWSLNALPLPSWLTVGAASGLTGSETGQATSALTFNSAGLAPGVYTTQIHLLLAGFDSIDVSVTMDVAV